ncbi:dTMP kinase [Streptomyces sp. NPDC004111]|uniref:dTMP kinase n=1 Tax=Streptomyces sp. NPDC004111 TaxID=3364690 RepID=UPI0036CAA5CC
MTPRPGVFVTVDGPSGVGKSTVLSTLEAVLCQRGRAVHATAEPSTSPLGTFTRAHADHIHGHALACLVAANRYEHLEHDVHPALATGHTVICDRYLASTLVLQQLDGVPEPFLLAVNSAILMPDLAVILTAAPATITGRLATRGRRHRFHHDPHGPAREAALYTAATNTLVSLGVATLAIDTTRITPTEAAARIADAIPHTPVASSATPTPRNRPVNQCPTPPSP